jgi:hypothetical protein
MEKGGHEWNLRFRKLEYKSRYDITVNLWEANGNSLNHLKPENYSLLQSVESGGTITIAAPQIAGYVLDEMQSLPFVTFTSVNIDNSVDFVYLIDNESNITLEELFGVWRVQSVFLQGGGDVTSLAEQMYPCILTTSVAFDPNYQVVLSSDCVEIASESGTYAINSNEVVITLPSQTAALQKNNGLLFMNVENNGMLLQLRLIKTI